MFLASIFPLQEKKGRWCETPLICDVVMTGVVMLDALAAAFYVLYHQACKITLSFEWNHISRKYPFHCFQRSVWQIWKTQAGNVGYFSPYSQEIRLSFHTIIAQAMGNNESQASLPAPKKLRSMMEPVELQCGLWDIAA